METGPLLLQEQIAFFLKKEELQDWAWVVHQQEIFCAKVARGFSGPATAVTKLIQFLFDEKVDHSFFILRNRIFTTAELTTLCRGMVRLAAKRVSGPMEPVDHGLSLPFRFHELGGQQGPVIQSQYLTTVDWQAPQRVENERAAEAALRSLLKKIPRGAVLHDHNRPIAVLICDEEGVVLQWAVNSNAKNKTLHAEVAALQGYFGRTQQSLPRNAVLYVSLKPCRMCSAMISWMTPTGCRVVYFENDPGAQAQGGEMEKRKMLFAAKEKLRR